MLPIHSNQVSCSVVYKRCFWVKKVTMYYDYIEKEYEIRYPSFYVFCMPTMKKVYVNNVDLLTPPPAFLI